MRKGEMTDKQQRFADEYLIDLNATRAYKVAYTSVKKDSTAKSAASRLLTNVNVQKYIEEQMEKMHSDKIADVTEVLEFLTSVMRREMKENIVVTLKTESSEYVPDKKGVSRKKTIKKEVPEVVEIDTKVCDSVKAAELIGKRYGIFKDSIDLSGPETIIIHDDITE